MSDIILLIKKLLNLANCSGANTNEAKLAAQRANELMEKHNIDKADVEKIPSGAQLKYDLVVVHQESSAIKAYKRVAFQSASKLFDLYFFTRTTTDGIEQLIITGQGDECEAAGLLGKFFLKEIERLYKVNLPRGLSQHIRANFRKNFKLQCARELFGRITEIKDYRPQSTALVCIDKHKKIEEWIEGKLALKSRRKSKTSFGYGSIEGGMASSQIKIREEVK